MDCILLILIFYIVKDYEDEKGDREHNKKTFVTLYGKKKTMIFQLSSLTALVSFIVLINLFIKNYIILLLWLPYFLFVWNVLNLDKSKSSEQYKKVHSTTRFINIVFILILILYLLY